MHNIRDFSSVAPISSFSSGLPLDEEHSKSLLIDFRSGESVGMHPSIAPLLKDGWTLHRAVPRLVEDEGCKLLVILSRYESASEK